jgi:hypothetical protein
MEIIENSTYFLNDYNSLIKEEYQSGKSFYAHGEWTLFNMIRDVYYKTGKPTLHICMSRTKSGKPERLELAYDNDKKKFKYNI